MRRVGCLLKWVFTVLIFGGLYFGPSVYLDAKGIVGPGTVVEKQEQIDRGRRTLSWWRRLQVVVEYQPPGQTLPSRTSIAVDEVTYDGLQVGESVRVRYQPEQWMRDFLLLGPQARLEHQSTLTIVEMVLSSIGAVALLGVLLLALITLARKVRSAPARRAILALALLDLAALALVAMRPAFLFDRDGPRVTATAVVRDVERFTERPRGRGRGRGRMEGLREMWGPFDRVELEVADGGQTVVAVDDIDVGSLPGLEVGSRVAVSYPPGSPREARIVEATRRHVSLNRLNVIVVFGQYLGCLFVFVLVGFIWDRARRRRRRLPLPQRQGP